jgi:hypothetical protein
MRPKAGVPNFDLLKKHDSQYCVECGMKRQSECVVYNCYINELNELNELTKLVEIDDPEQEPEVVVPVKTCVEKPMQIIVYSTVVFVMYIAAYLLFNHLTK